MSVFGPFSGPHLDPHSCMVFRCFLGVPTRYCLVFLLFFLPMGFVRSCIWSLNGSFLLFLDASTHLYKRACTSVGWSVGWSVTSYFLLVDIIKKRCGSLLACIFRFLSYGLILFMKELKRWCAGYCACACCYFAVH